MKKLKKLFSRRVLPVMLSVVMAFSSVPIPTFALETSEHEHTHEEDDVETCTPSEATEVCTPSEATKETSGSGSFSSSSSSGSTSVTVVATATDATAISPTIASATNASTAYQNLWEKMEEVLGECLGTTDMSKAEVYAIVESMDRMTLATACEDVDDLYADAEELGDEMYAEFVDEAVTLGYLAEALDEYEETLEFSDAYFDILSQMNAIVNQYEITDDISDNEIANAIIRADGNTLTQTMDEIKLIENDGMELTEKEFDYLVKTAVANVYSRFCDVLELLFTPQMLASGTVLNGQISIYSNKGTITVTDDNKVEIVNTISGFNLGTDYTFTITNVSGSKIKLYFDYAGSSFDEFSLSSRTGTYPETTLDYGASITITASSKCLRGQTDTLTLSGFVLTEVLEKATVTFEFDSDLGSVSVGGTNVPSGHVQEGVSTTDGIAVSANSNISGVEFIGWINAENGAILSTSAEFTLVPTEDITAKAIFIDESSAPWFMVGEVSSATYKDGPLGTTATYYKLSKSTYLFDDLNSAATTAVTSDSSKTIVLMNDGTLTAGTYTIPSGVTLLIPFDDENTLYTTTPCSTSAKTSEVVQKAYRTLTLENGANLIINGAVSLSAKHSYATGSAPHEGGTPVGYLSFIDTESGSNITVNNGGVLYAYGYITGSGSVTVNSGASVYEYFQIMDFRGGSQSTEMENRVFPLSQYYVQNIEVPMTIYAGATEYSYTTIYMSKAAFGSSVGFIGNKDSGALFELENGYVVKDYLEDKDRLGVKAACDLLMQPISMKVGLTSTLQSSEYVLGINNNISVEILDGSSITINQDMALLPGAEIIIDEGAECILSSGKKVYVYDADQWGKFVSPSSKTFIPVAYAPGRSYTRKESDLVDATILVNGIMNAEAGELYTTTGGANIYSTGSGVANLTAGTETVTYQLMQVSSTSTYQAIDITPVKLKNADGSYEETGDATYTYVDGVWVSDCDHTGGTATCTARAICSDEVL